MVWAACCAVATHDAIAPGLEYDRAAILDGQWWRMVTGHLTHYGWWHLLTNLGYLVLLVALTRKSTVPGWPVYWLLGAMAVSVGLLLEPEPLLHYRGSSALLYGLTVWCAMALARHGRPFLYGVPVLVAALVVLDLLGYSLPRSLPSGVSAYPLAHLYAVVAALLGWLMTARTHPARREA